MGNSTPKELNELGRTTVNAWTEQRQWAHRFYVHDVVKNWMLERFQENNYNYDLKYDLVSFCASMHVCCMYSWIGRDPARTTTGRPEAGTAPP